MAALIVAFAYLLGSVPTGFLLGYLAGVDVRISGSGNVGATNVARVAGKWLGLLTLLGDTAKGFVPVFIALQMGFDAAVAGWAALAAFLGHLYPVFLKFRGGKGVATALGALLAVAPAAIGVLAPVFLLVLLATRIVSLASIVAAGTAPVAIWLLGYPDPLIGITLLMALWILWRHRDNIQRLRAGAEPRFSL
ncbi:MAG TPA: glycerol-3-phosphate 1-O-acyltransferase PlsY [Candidatus Binatia bacterium]|jgi:glycerol-3-phosphate acyltransferase PlsY